MSFSRGKVGVGLAPILLCNCHPATPSFNVTNDPEESQAVVIFDDNHRRSRELAVSTGLQLGDDSSSRYVLMWINDKLTLRNNDQRKPIDTTIDFTSGRTLHRLKHGGGHGQPIARAVKTNESPLICDATAGFGKDAFVFASLGCTVVMLEKSVVVHALLQDALQRAKYHPEVGSVIARMSAYHMDSCSLPATWPLADLPQIVYLDPMYPEGKRTAKKEIQTLRGLLAAPQDEAALLASARATAQRVVVKRPGKSTPLAEVTPSGSITSPNTRYDIYSKS